MKALQVRCPQCGATLKAGDAPRVICEYCGTEAHVQRRSRVLDRVIPSPVRIPDGAHVAMQVRTASWAAIGIVFGVIALVGVGITCAVKSAVESAQRRASTRGGGVTPTPGRFLEWEGTSGGGALLADADGDGDLDAIGRCRELGNVDAVSIIALDGETGATLWETPKLGTYIETYQGSLALGGDTVMFASEKAEISAFAVNGGAALWTTTMPERVKHFCAGGTALGTDGVVRPVRAAEAGALPAPSGCTMLPHDHDGGDLTSRRDDAPYDLLNPLGLSTGDMVIGPGGRVLSGRRAKGTGVPTLIALDDRDKERWRADVPAQPLASAEGEPDLVAVGTDLACASYELNASGSKPHLVCFDLATGARRWDVELLEDNPLEGLSINELGVLVSMWGLLEVRDPADGKLRWKYGGR